MAENIRVWRWLGRRARISATSGKKPMSSIRSASSKTQVRTPSRLQPLVRPRWSKRRPGVAMMTSWECWRAVACGPMASPPMTRAALRLVCRHRSPIVASTCAASSRTGARTRARGPGFVGRGAASRRWRTGRAYATVLPLPVWADPRTSRPWRAGGMAAVWTGVERSKPISSTALRRAGCNPKTSKLTAPPSGGRATTGIPGGRCRPKRGRGPRRRGPRRCRRSRRPAGRRACRRRAGGWGAWPRRR